MAVRTPDFTLSDQKQDRGAAGEHWRVAVAKRKIGGCTDEGCHSENEDKGLDMF